MSCNSRCASPPEASHRARRALVLAAPGLLALGLAARAPGATPPRAPAGVIRALGAPRLAGSAVFRWWGLRVYRASLWVGVLGLDPGDLGARPFALSVRYACSLSGHAIADESAELIARLGLGSPAQRQRWRRDMRGLFPDVHDGDTLTGLYLPDARPRALTRFEFDDRTLGDVEGRDFAVAFFSIWLSPRCSEPRMRRALLAHLDAAS